MDVSFSLTVDLINELCNIVNEGAKHSKRNNLFEFTFTIVIKLEIKITHQITCTIVRIYLLQYLKQMLICLNVLNM